MLFLKPFFCLLLTNYGFIFVCVFEKVERVANLMIFTIYVISLPEQSCPTFGIIITLSYMANASLGFGFFFVSRSAEVRLRHKFTDWLQFPV